MMTQPPLTLFYDGLCPLCSREIAHYRLHLPADTRYIDITDPSFDARAHGLDHQAVRRQMHVKVGDELRVGVDAFLVLFAAMPRYRWLARLGRLAIVQFFLRLGYAVFARVRPWLPRRRRECATERCRV